VVRCSTPYSDPPNFIAHLPILASLFMIRYPETESHSACFFSLCCTVALEQLIEMEIALFGSATMCVDGNPVHIPFPLGAEGAAL